MTHNKIKNDPSILLATALTIEPGLMPYRYVLRNVGGVQPFVAHRENMKLIGDTWENESFYWGHYFDKEDEAREDFMERFPKARGLS